MAGREPEERVRYPVSLQEWRMMTFLHWRYEPEVLRRFVPPPFELDTWEDEGWVSLTPFRMTNFRLNGLPAVEPLSTFPETNLRTYVRDPEGKDGLWFLSLEADSLMTVVAASVVYGVPYRWAQMAVEEQVGEDITVRYRSHRRWGRSATHDIVIRPGEPADTVGERDHWLSGRWRAHTRIAGRPATVPVEHEPWPLWTASVVRLEQTILTAFGLPEPSAAPLVHYSPGVNVRLGAPQLRW